MEGLNSRTRAGLQGRLLAAAMRLPLVTELADESVDAWNRYVGLTELRIARQQYEPDVAFIPDFAGAGAATRARLLGGEVLIEDTAETDEGRPVTVTGARVTHARGAAFLRGADLRTLVTRLRARPSPALPPEETVRLHVVEEHDQGATLAVRMSLIETAAVLYDAEFDVRVRRHGRERVVVRSVATSIEELGLPSGRRAARRRRGLLWRLAAFWCFETAPGGVVAGCEWLALHRELPWPLTRLTAQPVREQAEWTVGRLLRTLRREAPMVPTPERRPSGRD